MNVTAERWEKSGKTRDTKRTRRHLGHMRILGNKEPTGPEVGDLAHERNATDPQ